LVVITFNNRSSKQLYILAFSWALYCVTLRNHDENYYKWDSIKIEHKKQSIKLTMIH
jgi:hypothetical protein